MGRLGTGLLLTLLLTAAGPASAADGDELAEVPTVLQDLKREARKVWTDARPVEVAVRFEREAGGLRTVAEMTFVTSSGVVDGVWEGLDDELPTVRLARREEETPQAVRNRWERRFGVIRRFDWNHCVDEWATICGLPRPEELGVGETLYLELEAAKRTPVLVLRHSEGEAACGVDDRGTIYPFSWEGDR